MPVEGQTGTAPDGTPVVFRGGRAVPQVEDQWGPGAKQLPNGSVVRYGPRGGMEVLNRGPKGAAGGAQQRAPDPNAFRRAKDSLAAIDDAKSRSNWLRTGLVGGLTQDWKGSPAYNLDKDLDTLKARASFDELQAMRAASPTGGALGGIAVEELKMLQAAEANLDVGQGEGQLDKNLERVRASVKGRTPGLDMANPIPTKLAADRDALPRGAYYVDAQGNVRRNDNGNAGNPIFRRSPSNAPKTTNGARALSDDDLKKALGL